MRRQESIIENKPYKILWNFQIETDHWIPAQKPEIVLTEKEKERVIWWILLRISFQTFFRMGTFIDSTHMKLYSPSK